MMNFGLDIFPEAVAMVYIVWKYGVGGTRTGDDINRKWNPETAPGKKYMYSNACLYTHPTCISTTDGVVILNSSTLSVIGVVVTGRGVAEN